MESDLLDAKDFVFSQEKDPYSSLRHDFSRQFRENSLDLLTNTNDSSFFDFNKHSYRPLIQEIGEEHSFSTLDNPFGRMHVKEEHSPNNSRSFLNTPYSPAKMYPSNANFSSQLTTNILNNNGKPANSQESAGLTPFRALHKFADDYYMSYDNHYEQSNPHSTRDFQTSNDFGESYDNCPLSFAWGNEPSKALKKSFSTPTDFFQNKMGFSSNFISPAYDNEEDEGASAHFGTDDSHPQKAKPYKDFTKLFGIKAEPTSASSSMPTQANSTTHTAEKEGKILAKEGSIEEPKTTCKSTPVYQAQVERDDVPYQYEEDDNDFLDTKNRSCRGLRVLSVKVKDVVADKRRTSYKEVADDLINEFNMKFKPRKHGEPKDEQNVKRRVYDALNVLIAADILKKDGKTVYCDDSVECLGFAKRRALKDEKNRLEREIHEIKKRNKNKVDTMKELVSKCLAIKHLLERNKQNLVVDSQIADNQKRSAEKFRNIKEELEDKENETPHKKLKMEGDKENRPSVQKSSRKANKGKENEKNIFENIKQALNMEVEPLQGTVQRRIRNDEIIKFPFIVLLSSSIENAMNLNMATSKTQLSVESKNPLNLFGDIDVLVKMGLNNVSREFFEANIPSEVQKYVSGN